MPITVKFEYPVPEATAAKPMHPARCGFGLLVRIALISVCLLFSSQSQSFAQERFKWIKYNIDDKPYAPWKISKHLSFGLTVEFEVETTRNLGLDKTENDNISEIEPTVQIGFRYDNKSHIRAYAEFELSKEFAFGNVKNNTTRAEMEVNEAYLTFHSLDDNLALTLGRMSVSDPREWVLDEELDGVFFTWRNTKFAFEAMYGREQLVKKDLFSDHDENEPDYYYARLSARLSKHSTAGIYALAQHGRTAKDTDLYWLGGSFAARAKGGLEYWAEAATVFGTEKGRDVRGYGFDVGVTKKFKTLLWKPRLTASFAFGSGDNGSGTDNAYRQTGIQGNSGRFGGRTSFKYYGEVFNPELSNLAVATFGVGFDLKNKTSIDFVYHHYIQHHASKKIRNSNLNEKPSGKSGRLGSEIDMIVGYKGLKNFKVDFTLGVFMPGKAFTKKHDPAWFIGLEFRKKF